MRARQTHVDQWLVVNDRLGKDWPRAVAALKRGGGILAIGQDRTTIRALRRAARIGGHRLVVERPGTALRVHSQRELTRALVQRTSLVLISPIFLTRSHPDAKPMSRMRAATLARLSGRQALALGGMTEWRFRKIAPLGFIGWAAIDAFRT